MSPTIPLGKREDLHLEFKSREALERPEIIAREVAAMLNAEGGTVWIGLRDQDGTAVEIEAVPNPEQEADRLQSSLVDRLEPSPLPREVQVEQIPVDDKDFLLRVLVEPKAGRKPYALLKSSGRHFQVRTGNRIRNMSREEIREQFSASSQTGNSVAETIERVLNDRQEYQQAAGEQMWLRILPAGDIGFKLSSGPLSELLDDPSKTGNRYGGWHVAQSSSGVGSAREKRFWSYGEAFDAEIGADGGMRFALSLGSLRLGGEEREFHPWPLLEYPVSALRLASKIYPPDLQRPPGIVSDLALFGVRGWKLSRGSFFYGEFLKSDRPSLEYAEDRDLAWPKPLVFEYREVLDEPDRCGFRLIRRVYEAFGFEEDAIPKEYDRKAGRLVFND
jgi:Schlafen, AlbA_2